MKKKPAYKTTRKTKKNNPTLLFSVAAFLSLAAMATIYLKFYSADTTALEFPAQESIAAGVYPPQTTLTLSPQPTGINRPGYITGSIIDPTFGTTITRIADNGQNSMDCSGCAYIRHTYSRNQPWNSDGSLIMLGFSYQPKILNGNTYQYMKTINLPNNQALWSNTNPNYIYDRGVDSSNNPTTELVRFDISGSSMTKTVVKKFDATKYKFITIGEGEGNLSNDDKYVALVGHKLNSTVKSLILYDIPGNVILKEQDLGTGDLDWVSVSQSGRYVVVSWRPDGSGAEQGLKVYDRVNNTWRHLHNNTEHGDIGYDASGSEVYVQYHDSNNDYDIYAFKLSDGTKYRVLPTDWTTTHISCRNLSRPGWCYVSDSLPDPNRVRPGSNETFSLKIQPLVNGAAAVERFAHQHQSFGVGYEGGAYSVPNRDGSKVMFASDWEQSSPTYSYVAEFIPAGAVTNLIKNPGFELDNNADGKPDNWSSNSQFTRSSAKIHGGSYSGRFTGTGANYVITQSIPEITAGKTYNFETWTNIPATSDTFTFKYEIRWFNSAGTAISTVNLKSFAAATGGWVNTKKSAVAPAGAVRGTLRMNTVSLNAPVYVDDISFN